VVSHQRIQGRQQKEYPALSCLFLNAASTAGKVPHIVKLNTPCPCDSNLPYDACCGPLHRGEGTAGTAEALMRSRYSAFVRGDVAYLLASWHPSTRPERLDLDPRVRWAGLEVLASAGGVFDTHGTVEFKARHDRGVQHERSRFRREDGRWYYVDGSRPRPGRSQTRSRP
jgi:SEC-C motif domain protein